MGRDNLAEVVIGTAGHVDHGKTELVRALTGHDTDRLPEEKRRGISIDLGFAQFRLPSGRRAAIVDVPGHERFVKNMVAGVTGIDLALLVIAADEGVMPQTEEHLDILKLLGVASGIVAVTKIDLVEREWLQLVEEEIYEAVAGSPFEAAPLIKVSSRTGEGLDQLRQTIDQLLPKIAVKNESALPRLPIDRVFSVAGFGTVVTGTLIAGSIHLDDRLELQPSNQEVRVRQLQVHGQRVETAVAGQRVAVNIVGASPEPHRGQVLVQPGSFRPTQLFAAALQLLSKSAGVRSGTRVRLHVGTSEVLGRLTLLDRNELVPGHRCYALFRTEEPVVVTRGDRYIIRSYSPMRTIGGGRILDVDYRYRRWREETSQALELLEHGNFEDVVLLALHRENSIVNIQNLQKRLAAPYAEVAAAIKKLAGDGRAIVVGEAAVIAAGIFERLAGKIGDRLSQFHRQQPLRPGMPREELRAELAPGADPKQFGELLNRLAAGGKLTVESELVRLPDYRPQLNPQLSSALTALRELYRSSGAAPPDLDTAAAAVGIDKSEARSLIDLLVGNGDLIGISEGLYYTAPVYAQLTGKVCTLIARNGPQTVAEIRDHLATSRKFVVPLLEHLDVKKITRRVGDRRDLTARGKTLIGPDAAAGHPAGRNDPNQR